MWKSFRAFIESPEGREAIDAEFIERFQSAGPSVLIDTRTKLGQFIATVKVYAVVGPLINDLIATWRRRYSTSERSQSWIETKTSEPS